MKKLSICIICKNEQKNIEKCLSSLVKTNFELVVVDTGSTDATKEIAARFTDKVYDFPWINDFAAAKNFAISKASNQYVMIIDSDEFLESMDVQKLQKDLEQYPDYVGRIFRRNVFERNGSRQENTEWINRIFSKELFRYEGCIHEQVTAINSKGYETYEAPVVILHTGYDLPENERRQKAERNIRLLRQELKCLLRDFLKENDIPETAIGLFAENETEHMEMQCVNEILAVIEAGDDLAVKLQHEEQLPYVLYQLGKGYYMAGDYALACVYFSCALSFDLNPKLEYVIDMVETYGYAMINSGQASNALLLENIYDEFGNTADFQFLMGLVYMNNERFEDAVSEFLKATKHASCRNIGANSYLAFYNIGVIYECLGNEKEAKRYYKMCQEYEPAQSRLQMLSIRTK